MSPEWVAWGGRLSIRVPRTFTMLPNSSTDSILSHEYVVTIDIEDGRLVCTKLQINQAADGPPVNTDAVRKADITDWIADDAVTQNLVFDRIENVNGGIELDFHTAPPAGFNGNGMTDAALDHFAQHYAYLMVTGQRPSGVFLHDYSMSRPTVTRWLHAARSRNILIDEHERIDHESWEDPGSASAPTAKSRGPKSAKASGRPARDSATTTEKLDR